MLPLKILHMLYIECPSRETQNVHTTVKKLLCLISCFSTFDTDPNEIFIHQPLQVFLYHLVNMTNHPILLSLDTGSLCVSKCEVCFQ